VLSVESSEKLESLITRRSVMRRRTHTCAIVALAITRTLAFAFGNTASAAPKGKKLTFEQAWKFCKDKLDKEGVPNTIGAANERYIRGGACMKSLGYRI
jgi:hypothetical protein